MSDFALSLDFLLDSEDFQREYKVVPDLCPAGTAGPCFAISGINSGVFPAQFCAIQAAAPASRGPLVAAFYETEFWNRYHFALVDDQDIAERLLDEAVWSGPGTAVELLQKAVNALGGLQVTVDGILGPATASAVNQAPATDLLVAYRKERLDYLTELPMYKAAPPGAQSAYRARALR